MNKYLEIILFLSVFYQAKPRDKIVADVNFDLADCDVLVACLFRDNREGNSKYFGSIFKQFFVLCFLKIFELIGSQNIAV